MTIRFEFHLCWHSHQTGWRPCCISHPLNCKKTCEPRWARTKWPGTSWVRYNIIINNGTRSRNLWISKGPLANRAKGTVYSRACRVKASESDFEGDKECRIAVKVSVENWKADDRVNQSKSSLRDEPAFSSGKPERSDGQRSITQDFFLKKEVPVGY